MDSSGATGVGATSFDHQTGVWVAMIPPFYDDHGVGVFYTPFCEDDGGGSTLNSFFNDHQIGKNSEHEDSFTQNFSTLEVDELAALAGLTPFESRSELVVDSLQLPQYSTTNALPLGVSRDSVDKNNNNLAIVAGQRESSIFKGVCCSVLRWI